MKNKEKYFDEMVDHICANGLCDFLLSYIDNEVCDKHCDKCKELFKTWLEEEYIEQPKLSHDEYVILKNMRKECKWIARNIKNSLQLYLEKPTKDDYEWYEKEGYMVFAGYDHLFQFIKWEDEEPYNIQELLEEYELKNMF